MRRDLTCRGGAPERHVDHARVVCALAVGAEPLAERGHLLVGHRRPYPAGAHAVRADALRPVIDRDALGQHRETGLRRAVRQRLGARADPRRRRDGDDRPAPRDQVLDRRPRDEKAPVRFVRRTSSQPGRRASAAIPRRRSRRCRRARRGRRSVRRSPRRRARHHRRPPCPRRSHILRSRPRPPRSARSAAR